MKEKQGVMARRGGVKAVVLVLIVLFVSVPAAAAEFERVMAEARGHWRLALWYAQTDNSGVAGVELEEFRSRWQRLVEAGAGAPPDAYGRDPRLRETMVEIVELASRAATLLDSEDARSAHAVLSQIGDTMATLRRRNGITSFADDVIRLREAVDALSRLIRIDDAIDARQLAALRASAGELEQWAAAVMAALPDERRRDAAFMVLLRENEAGIRALGVALDRGQPAPTALEVVGLIRVIRSNYHLLFIRYG